MIHNSIQQKLVYFLEEKHMYMHGQQTKVQIAKIRCQTFYFDFETTNIALFIIFWVSVSIVTTVSLMMKLTMNFYRLKTSLKTT